MLENKFKTKLVKEIKTRFPGCFVFHLDPTEMQGAPDLLILYGSTWAALEGKKEKKSHKQPNQDYYISLMNQMAYASLIYPENKEDVLNEIQRSFEARGATRIAGSQ